MYRNAEHVARATGLPNRGPASPLHLVLRRRARGRLRSTLSRRPAL